MFGFSWRYSVIAHAMEIPSYVLVPLPISSSSIRLFWDALFKIFAASCISTKKVLSPFAILSEAPTRVKILSTIPMLAAFAGTKQPTCASNTIKPTCLRKHDLPLILGPVKMIIWLSPVSSFVSLGIYLSPTGKRRSITGWRPSLIIISSPSLTSGFI